MCSTVEPTLPLPQICTLRSDAGNECKRVPKNVSALSDAELDAHIRSCGELAVTEEAHGNHEGAAWWTARMYEAIRSRTPEHQARLTADLDRRIDESTFDGRWALEMARRVG
jgi:hypothetical protein